MMKNQLAVFVSMVAVALPMSVYAHPDSHSHYGLMAFLQHFFTQPDHLAIMCLLLAILFYSRTSLRGWRGRSLSRRPVDKK